VTGDRFHILFVCSGNICRSPFAEVVTRHLLARRLHPREAECFSVGSAGVSAVVGADMDSRTRAELIRRGLHDESRTRHVAQQVDRAAVAAADLVLTAEREHRALVVATHPAALRVTFSLLEFSRLLASAKLDPFEQDAVLRARAAVAAAAMERGMAPPVTPEDDSVPDPMGGPEDVRAQSYALIGSATRTVLDAILGERRTTSCTNRTSATTVTGGGD
jgi:protein-tyrosine phosphatase